MLIQFVRQKYLLARYFSTRETTPVGVVIASGSVARNSDHWTTEAVFFRSSSWRKY
jgi:hypothetical protein